MIPFPFSYWQRPDTAFNDSYLSFDGTDEIVEAEDTTSYNFTKNEAFSVSCWCRINSLPSVGFNYTIFSKRNTGGGNGGYILIIRDDGTIRFMIQGESGGSTNTALVDTENLPIINEWFHICCTYSGVGDGSGINVYINGLLVATGAASDVFNLPIDNSSVKFSVGASRDLTTGNITLPLDGDIDEVSIFDYELTTLQIEEICVKQKAIDLSELSNLPIAWWRMGDEGTYDGTDWTFPNQISGSTLTSTNMEQGDVNSGADYRDNVSATTYITAASIEDDTEIGVVHNLFKQIGFYDCNGGAMSSFVDQMFLVSPTQESAALINAWNPGTDDGHIVGTGTTWSPFGLETSGTSAVSTNKFLPSHPTFCYQQSKQSTSVSNRGVIGVADSSDVSRQIFYIYRQRNDSTSLDRFVARYRNFSDTLIVNWGIWDETVPLVVTNPNPSNPNLSAHWSDSNFIGNETHSNTPKNDIAYLGGRNNVTGLSIGDEGPADNTGDIITGWILFNINSSGDIGNDDMRRQVQSMLTMYNKYVGRD